MDINQIENIEQKKILAKKIANKVENGQTIGFGSGSTSYLTTIEIGKKIKKENIKIKAIPTSKEIEEVCLEYEIETSSLLNDTIDWVFDGADEIDPDNNMIKGMGKAMFKEKLNILNSPKTYILVDETKFVKNLGEKHPVPVEVFPPAINYVSNELKKLGAIETTFRGMTENGNAILDAKFENIYCNFNKQKDKINVDENMHDKSLLKQKENLEKEIKKISGVIESGLFLGYDVEVIRN